MAETRRQRQVNCEISSSTIEFYLKFVIRRLTLDIITLTRQMLNKITHQQTKILGTASRYLSRQENYSASTQCRDKSEKEEYLNNQLECSTNYFLPVHFSPEQIHSGH